MVEMLVEEQSISLCLLSQNGQIPLPAGKAVYSVLCVWGVYDGNHFTKERKGGRVQGVVH